MKKNEKLILSCENIGSQMEGVCRHENIPIFVNGMLKGEKGEVVITKVHAKYAFGRLLSLQIQSPNRQTPPCPYFWRCGGCSCQHMTYGQSLVAKHQQVIDCFQRIGGITLQPEAIIGMDNPFHYRNKSALPVGGSVDAIQMGFFSPRSHDIVPVERCLIAMQPSNQLQTQLMQWMNAYHIKPYDEKTHTGIVRHLVTRVNQKGQAMAVLVINGDNIPYEKELVQTLSAAQSLYLNIHKERSNVIFGKHMKHLSGLLTLEDNLCNLRFRVSPQSFFQVNPVQTEILYQTALTFCALDGTQTVTDLYCGAGTISLLLAKHAKKVLGIEVVEAAIQNAKENAKCNHITNATFLCAKAEDILPKLVREGYRPDVVTLDPPRKGVEPQVIDAIAIAAPERIVYISCNVATLARDAKLFSSHGYYVTRCQPVDMFCWTSGVECVVVMQKTSFLSPSNIVIPKRL